MNSAPIVQRPVKKETMVKETIRVGFYALLAWIFIPGFLSGIESQAFPEKKIMNGRELSLRGSGVLRYMMFIRAF